MAKKNNDEENVIEIITIVGDKGEELEFVELATILYEDKRYIVLDPLEEIEGIEEGDVLIYRVDDEGAYHNVDDERVVESVFDKFIEYASSEEFLER